MSNQNKIKSLASSLAREMVMSSVPEVYIASAFFDDKSKEWVSAKEQEFDGMRIPYFSPRQDGINFRDVTGDLRSERIKAIFKNNVRNLTICKSIVVNLTPCNGRLDLGTLWEYGYWIGSHGSLKLNDFESYDALAIDQDLKSLVLDIEENLSNVNPSSDELKILFHRSQDAKRISDSISISNLDLIPVDIGSTLLNAQEVTTKGKNIFLIDDLPFQMFILMGWMYAKKIPYYTATFKDYGSNVMIAASSRGHIKLSGLVDDTYRDDIV